VELIYARCAGLDVHKKTVSACINIGEGEKNKRRQVRTFGAFTPDLLALPDWLKEHGEPTWRWRRPGSIGVRFGL
jgi:hypothetical protein